MDYQLLSYLYNKTRNKNTIRIYETLRERPIDNYLDNSLYQEKKLKAIISLCSQNIPYYKDRCIDYSDLDFRNKFLSLPLLTKDIIRNNKGELLNDGYKNIGNVFKNTSGGSTGEPVEFFQTQEQIHFGMASYYYALHFNRVNIYSKSVDLWGAERDMYKTDEKLDLKSLVHNKLFLNTFVLSDDIIKKYIHRMNMEKPKFIKAYVHSIFDISKYINQNQIKIDFTPTIHCTTGPLYPEMREEIKRAFNGAHVYNFYGSREVSAIASEDLAEDGLKVLYDNVFVEILNNGIPVRKGEEGEIVITTLNNLYMPLIRYKIGDRGIKGDDLDFGTLNIQNVLGRTLGVIFKSDGTKIDGQFFTSLFFNKKGIKKFQLIQIDLNLVELSIVKSEDFDEIELNQILNRIKKELNNVELILNFKEEIDLTSTGKIMYVFSKLDCQ
ncbi:hypothetical protein [Sphingobacterium sp.]|uniref:hypothetical protein n=1 Tax=Sphingobacterium sp. TaxID=341027 RepID=UPI0028AD1882|nr:hypothetical protein [Sphingobacterium sp.]